jgi:hypothetical protein
MLPLAVPPLPSLVAPSSLSSRCACLVLVGCCIASSLVAPPSLLRRLVVELRQGKADDDDAGHDADTGHGADTMRMLEREREGRDDFYKSKDSLNNDNFISLFDSQFKLLAVVPHHLLSCCSCYPLPYHPSPLLSRHRLSPRAAPVSCWLVVASPPLSLRHHLSCAG